MAFRGNSQWLVVNKTEGRRYGRRRVSYPLLSQDGKRVAYFARDGTKSRAIIDGSAGKGFDAVANLAFSPDGKHVAYVAWQAKKWRVVLDGKEGAEYDAIGKRGVVFSLDGRRTAYQAQRGDKQFIVLDGVAGAEYEVAGVPVFSPDGNTVAHIARTGGKWHVVVNGAKGKACDGFVRGSRLVFDSNRSLHALAVRNQQLYRIDIQVKNP
jgi:Tol biopolymer transport system component